MIKLYGIPNCDTVKKAQTWLKDNNISFEFHDFKKEGIAEERLAVWSEKLGWEPLLNKRGTTWKKLAPEEQQSATTKEGAFTLMRQKTSIIKRPVLESDNTVLSGFDAELYKNTLL